MRLRPICLAALFVAACSPTDGDDDDVGGTDPSAEVDTDLPADTTIAVSASPHLEAFFAVPKQDGTADAALEDKVVELIDGTPKGARIRIAMFGFSRTRVATHLGDARDRGVDVQVVLDKQKNEVKAAAARFAQPEADDDDADEDADAAPTPDSDPGEAIAIDAKKSEMNPAITILQQRLKAGSITFCTRGHGSCQGTGINHNKIYMFSSTGGAHDVVVQSSANLTTHHLHNNLVISRGDHDLYKHYVHYFEDLQARHENLDYYRHESGNHTIAYYFPRESGDTIVTILDKVHCEKHNRSHIRVAMAFFDSDRAAIADKLGSLQDDGCDVAVNMRHAGKGVSASIIKTLKHHHVDVAEYDDSGGTNIHSKYLLIDSDFDGSHRRLVWTGSHNYTGGALRHNDEALLRVDDATVYDAFWHNWNVIRGQIE